MTREPAGQELIDRYRRNYRMPNSAPLTEAMIRRHWDLERSLTRQLLESTPANRRDVFEACYTRLYEEIPWLNETAEGGTAARVEADASPADSETSDRQFAHWPRLIGPPPKRVYEIGPGRGELIRWLARRGYECRAAEITSERGAKWTEETPRLSWGVTDGVHLDRFEPAGSFDTLISQQVIEHLHPDDLIDHFRGACALLRPGGRYILSTPHVWSGPADLSRVFARARAECMHLKEYLFGEVIDAARAAGFRRFLAPPILPRGMGRLVGRDRVLSSYGERPVRTLTAMERAADGGSMAWLRRILVAAGLMPENINLILGR